jgi:WD40 repeat protein
MNNNLTTTNQNAKSALIKSKNLLNITDSLLSKKAKNLINEIQFVPYFPDGNTEFIKSVYLSPNENYIISGSDDNTIKLWDIKSKTSVNILDIQIGTITSSVITPDDKILIIGTEKGSIKSYEIKTGKNIRVFRNHSGSINLLKITTNGKYLISISSFNYEQESYGQEDYETLKIWDIEENCSIKSDESHIGPVTFNEEFLVYKTHYYTDANYYVENIIIRDIESGRTIDFLEGHAQKHSTKITSLAITPDGNTIISGGGDNQNDLVFIDEENDYIAESDSPESIKIWDIKESRYTDVLRGHTDLVTTLVVTSDGKTIISGSKDKTIKIWDIQSKECINTLKGHIDSVNSIAVTQDGKSIMSRCNNNIAKLWDIKSGKCVYSTYNLNGCLPITVFENEYLNTNEENIGNFIKVNDTPISCRELTQEEMEHFIKVRDENIKNSFDKDEKNIYQNNVDDIDIENYEVPF